MNSSRGGTESQSLLDAALAYAARGWPVMPLYDLMQGHCSCSNPDCKKPGKHPQIDDWTQAASCDPAQIRAWWQQWPSANVGILTGERSHLAVLDVDPRNGGDLALEDLEHAYHRLPDTPMVISGGKGPHHYFALDGPLGKFDPGPGLNLQADGALVVAPPSLHHSGNIYEWEASSRPDEVALAPLPDWLRALGEAKASAPVEGVDLPATLPSVDIQTLKVSHRIKYVIQMGHDPDDPQRYRSRSEALFAVLQALLAGGHDDATLASVVLDKRYGISEKVLSQKNARNPRYWEQTKTWVAREIARAKAKHHARSTPDMTVSATAAAHQGQNGSTAHPPHDPTPPTQETTGQEGPLPYSDYTNALAFVREHGQNLRYCYPWKAWLVWNGQCWKQDTSGAVMRMAKQTIKRLARHAENLDDIQAKALMGHVKASLSTAKLKALVECAQSEPGIPVQPENLDRNPLLLNVANGTLDLHTGELRPHRPADLMTKCLMTAYDAEAPCPTWERFQWRIMGGSQGADSPDMSAGELETRQAADTRAERLIRFKQRFLGYSLTADCREQCLCLYHGYGANGKTTELATIETLLGDYAQSTPSASLLVKDRHDGIPNDIARLRGARLVTAVEIGDGKRLDEELIKRLTGQDTLTARFLHGEFFDFKAEFKLLVACNHLPTIRGTDHAIWRRLHRIPFTVTIPDEEQDKELAAKLRAEIPGILRWAVQGCLDWQREGLGVPEEVRAATKDYRASMDILGRFIEECCMVSPQVRAKASDLYDAYKKWCEASSEYAVTLTAFGNRLEEQGFAKVRSGGIWRLGIGLHTRTA